jgi:glycosyltransferase involved in cell wall biosynthesis
MQVSGMPLTAFVVIPVFNERATIEEILRKVQTVDIKKEIIVVDDRSTDGTKEILAAVAAAATQGQPTIVAPAREHRFDNLRIFFQGRNQGKGAALRRGFQVARRDIVIVQDADLEYDPQDYFALIDPIERGLADVVYGSRFLGGGPTGFSVFGIR